MTVLLQVAYNNHTFGRFAYSSRAASGVGKGFGQSSVQEYFVAQAVTDQLDYQDTSYFSLAAPSAYCHLLTNCSAQQYELQAPTVSTDRVCRNITICSSAQYETAAPTLTSDRSCASIVECTSEEYEDVAPTLTSNRVCTGECVRECVR